ncbi:hypothetical protein HN014_16600 [Aquimarina sp. TRL1]|uniref:hypothetical protein n=1 Tax=Aquimarina sp. (strain TRL1) TaxID=2736252 RepID=UPI00158D2F0E|nr:hypothetical protein [Aquimarina sp. TRL1]QKX06464.1 hypothetical protein HN014_16600 [Aquimarina sp. TRL1]
MSRLFLNALVFMLFINCSNVKNIIEVKQLETDVPVVLWVNHKYKKIITIDIPFKFKIHNKSLINKKFTSYEYYDNDIQSKRGFVLYLVKGNQLIKQGFQPKTIKQNSSGDYIAYTSHILDSLPNTQNKLRAYLDDMLINKKDSLLVGSLKSFSKNHNELIQKTVKNDTIIINFLEKESKGGTWSEVKTPIDSWF